jgi:TolA-binding protein
LWLVRVLPMRKMKRTIRRKNNLFARALFLAGVAFLSSCNSNSPDNRYLLAERLLEDKKYEAAISEFQEIVDKSPNSPLGIEGQLKVAQIQHLYLGKTKEAVESYKKFLRRNKDEARRGEIERVLADLQFQIFENYGDAIHAYKSLFEKDPKSPEAPYFLFNIGRAQSFQKDFDTAVKTFQQLVTDYPTSSFANRAKLEVANALNMGGKCRDAIKKYEELAKSSPGEIKVLAVFGEAECAEELDDLDTAYELLGTIKSTYPSPAVVDMKMKRIKRRKILRRR